MTGLRLRRRLWHGAGIVLVSAALFGACGAAGRGAPGRDGVASAPGVRSGAAIAISNFMFSPMSLRVAPGATVSVTNNDSATHTLTATDGEFDTGNIAQHQTKLIKVPTKPGTYHFICNIHQYMTGSITVT